MHSKEIFIGSNDVDSNLELKISSLFKFMQDIAVEHAELLNVGKTKTIDLGMNWVIARFNVHINRLPRYQESVTISTYPSKTMKFIFPRNFEIRDLNNNLLLKASSAWLVINSKDRQICMNPFENNDLPYETYEGELGLPKKIINQEAFFIENREVRYSDIDLNGHVNNTRYLDYVFDMHNTKFFKENKIKTLLINYNKELRDGENIDLSMISNLDYEYIKGEFNGENIFSVEITYEKRA